MFSPISFFSFYVVFVIMIERCSIIQDLNDVELINEEVLIRPRGLEKNQKLISRACDVY